MRSQCHQPRRINVRFRCASASSLMNLNAKRQLPHIYEIRAAPFISGRALRSAG